MSRSTYLAQVGANTLYQLSEPLANGFEVVDAEKGITTTFATAPMGKSTVLPPMFFLSYSVVPEKSGHLWVSEVRETVESHIKQLETFFQSSSDWKDKYNSRSQAGGLEYNYSALYQCIAVGSKKKSESTAAPPTGPGGVRLGTFPPPQHIDSQGYVGSVPMKPDSVEATTPEDAGFEWLDDILPETFDGF